MDAAVFTTYGVALQPAATPLPDACLEELRALVPWRLHLREQLQAARNHAEHAAQPFVRKQRTKLIRQLTTQIEAAETELAAALARAPRWQAQINKLIALDGVRQLTAVSVLCQMPELGRINRGQARRAGRTGPVDPPKRTVGRPAPHRWGRAAVRRALYMAAVSLARLTHTTLGRFYRHLRATGKPAKVALTAVMRKLLMQIDQALKPA